MRYVVVDIAASSRGALTILTGLYDYIAHNSKDEWFFLLSERYIQETSNCKVLIFPEIKKSRIKRLMFDLYRGKKIIDQISPDVVINLQNTYIYGIKYQQVIYQDQSIPFQTTKEFSIIKREERKYALYQHVIGCLIKKATRKANAVIVQTKWMKEAIKSQCNLPDSRVFVLSPTISIPENIREKNNIRFKTDHFFYPASAAPYKNHKCIYQACEILEREQSKVLVEFTINGKETNSISCIGPIPHDEVLQKLMTSTLIFPSYIETYGLPLAEARQLNTIVLAADTEFSREVLNGYGNAYFFKYDNPRELASLMKAVQQEKIKKKETAQVMMAEDSVNNWSKFCEICFQTANGK